MDAEIDVPKRRVCLDCGRVEVWDEDAENWVVGDDSIGDVHCIHSWDITGEFSPIKR